MHPQLDLLDELIRVFGYPALLTAFVWAVRKYDKGEQVFTEVRENTAIAVKSVADVKAAVDVIQSNHLQHLQQGIERLAVSNDTAVEVLREIKTGIAVLSDRLPRA